MTRSELTFVSFEYRDGAFVAFLPVDIVAREHEFWETLRAASRCYGGSIRRLKALLRKMEATSRNRRPIRALQAWQIGDEILSLRRALADLSLELDGVYDHLTKHLGVSRSWLEKTITFRRYLPERCSIPSGLRWARCRDRPRRAAEELGRAPRAG